MARALTIGDGDVVVVVTSGASGLELVETLALGAARNGFTNVARSACHASAHVNASAATGCALEKYKRNESDAQ